MTYSIAIRTLGLNQEILKKELLSIQNQTIAPEKVIIYIAEGYQRPEFQISNEEYIWVKKGMVAQRALEYNEISSDLILTLDDDVELGPTFAETILAELIKHNADIVGVDIFKNHEAKISGKIYAFLSNIVYPHWHSKFAFEVHKTGSFSYINNPKKTYYQSQCCGGPAILWKKAVLINLKLNDESWLDSLGFAYGDDQLITYKSFVNGYHLGVCFNTDIKNLDAQSSSNNYRLSEERFKIRTKAMFIIWWRTIYKPYGNSNPGNKRALAAGLFKLFWLLFIFISLSIPKFNLSLIRSYFNGLNNGIKYVKSKEFCSLSTYILK